jgi:hypothetical protein
LSIRRSQSAIADGLEINRSHLGDKSRIKSLGFIGIGHAQFRIAKTLDKRERVESLGVPGKKWPSASPLNGDRVSQQQQRRR